MLCLPSRSGTRNLFKMHIFGSKTAEMFLCDHKVSDDKIKMGVFRANDDWHTGAMYSSVPTKEFDCVFGSAKKIGGGWLLDLLFFFNGGGLITWNSVNISTLFSQFQNPTI